jgi:predicted N-formylglutamate amidohydrolase
MPDRPFSLLFTAEHASPRIPKRYREVARRAGATLRTHRGYDPGTLELAKALARHFRAAFLTGRYSRLLIELNRSPGHPQLWSEYSASLTPEERQALINHYYEPYRRAVADHVRRLALDRHCVVHIGVHSFTPELDGVVRQADIGLLYDPDRRREAAFCAAWKARLLTQRPGLRVRRNYPYRGTSDGLVPMLRGLFQPRQYIGVELEVNQAFPLGLAKRWRELQHVLVQTLAAVVAGR